MRKPLEQRVEDYLVERVESLGGEVRKCVWAGRRGAPDRFIMLGKHHAWVELKRPGEKPTDQQRREHERMKRAGCDVWVIDNPGAADILVTFMLTGGPSK